MSLNTKRPTNKQTRVEKIHYVCKRNHITVGERRPGWVIVTACKRCGEQAVARIDVRLQQVGIERMMREPS